VLVQVMHIRRVLRAGYLCDRVPRRHLDGARKFVDPRDDTADQREERGDIRHAELYACMDARVLRVREIVANAPTAILPCMGRE